MQVREWFKNGPEVVQHRRRQARRTGIERCVKAARSATLCTSGSKVVQQWFKHNLLPRQWFNAGSKMVQQMRTAVSCHHNHDGASRPRALSFRTCGSTMVQKWFRNGAHKSASGSGVVQKWINAVGVKRATQAPSAASKQHGAQLRPRMARYWFKSGSGIAPAPPPVVQQ